MKSIATIVILISLHVNYCFADDDFQIIINNTKQAYRLTEFFSCNGTVKMTSYKNDSLKHSSTVEFSNKLKKPNLFLIHWKGTENKSNLAAIEGALWSNGDETFFYGAEFDGYFSFSDQLDAISFTSGISRDVTYRIPSLFLTSIFTKKIWLDNIKKINSLSNDDESIITINVGHHHESINDFQLGISKDKSFIVRHYFSATKIEAKDDRIRQLRMRRESFLNNFQKVNALIGDSETENDLEVRNKMVERFDREIQDETARTDFREVSNIIFEQTFSDISTRSIPDSEFNFQIPDGVEFKGDSLEKTLKHKK